MEISFEEKYKNLVEAIKEFRDINRHDEGICNWVNDNVPELAETDDERIRKVLLEIFSGVDKKDWRGITTEKIIDWLERQGKKPQGKTALEAIKEEKVDNANKVESKFHEGDWIVNNISKDVFLIKSLNNGYYTLEDINGNIYLPSCENNYHLWTIEDANPGDILVDVYGNIGIFQKSYDFDWISYCSLGCNGGFQNFEVEHENDKTHPATQEQLDTLFAKIKEVGYKWAAEEKRKNIGSKFKVGDWITNGHRTRQITFIDSRYWYSEIEVIGNTKDIDKTYHLWTITDAKDGDIIYDGGAACIFRKTIKFNDSIWIDSYCGINVDNEFNINDEDERWCLSDSCSPATKEQRELLFSRIEEEGYKWDDVNKELK